MSVCMCIGGWKCQISPGARVTGDWKLSDVDGGNQTQVLCKSSESTLQPVLVFLNCNVSLAAYSRTHAPLLTFSR